jgi:hypothetical protein
MIPKLRLDELEGAAADQAALDGAYLHALDDFLLRAELAGGGRSRS